ncbi:MAG: HD-GYP domain-containing protein [Gudongella sp.]|nr:HD-GYP domain-containing protein [Gudongella sp.]
MRKIPIEYAKEGDLLGRTLYNNLGCMLLREGIRLTEKSISKLKSIGCFSIYIKDRYTEEIIEEIIKPKTMNRIHSLQENLKNIIIDFNNSGKVDAKKVDTNVRNINEIINEIVCDVLFSKNILENLVNISIYDDYTMNHSLNVMMLSTVIARDKNFNMKEIKKLATGCIFHDIGKTFIPIEIINKPGKLTIEEFEIVKTHSEKGYEFLKNYTDLPMTSINIALCHHERENGSGYPRNLLGEEIHIFSKIASICDVFDALISDRPYRRGAPVNEAMEYLFAAGGDEFSIETIKAFSESINIFPKDTLVSLSDGREGIIYEANNEIHSRPKIMIYGEDKKEVNTYVVDLMDYNNIIIDKVLYEFSFSK